jgi:hypothetical protein
VLFKGKEGYQIWIKIHKNFPVSERYNLGARIDLLFLNLLERIFVSSYMSVSKKVAELESAIIILDKLKFFLQIAWENKLIHTNHYGSLSKILEEVGRQLGGWRRGLLSKTPPPFKAGEKTS